MIVNHFSYSLAPAGFIGSFKTWPRRLRRLRRPVRVWNHCGHLHGSRGGRSFSSPQWTEPAALNLKLKSSGPWLTERIQPLERGRHGSVERRITVRDIFGLSSLTLTYRRKANLKVKPQATGFQIEAMLRQGDGDGFSRPDGQPVGDLIEMRRYGPGDPIRLILWSRENPPSDRTPERAVAPTAAYFLAGPMTKHQHPSPVP